MGFKISIAICTYNGEKYIVDQLSSILNQTRLPDEIILCDDNSKDNTINKASQILKYSGIKCRIIRNKTNIGVVKNFEKAINICSGDLIFTCDQDDLWLQDKIKCVEEVFVQNGNCVLVFSNACLVDSELSLLGKDLWSSLGFYPSDISANKKSKTLLDILLSKCVVTGATMAFRATVKDMVAPFPNSWIHDGWIAIISCFIGDVRFIDKCLVLYRQHNNNVIGVPIGGLIEKSKRYILNFPKMKEIRLKRRDRYKDVLERLSRNDLYLHEKDLNKIVKCIKFWDRRVVLSNCSILRGIGLISKDIINGKYNQYYSGIRGACRDFVLLCVRHKTNNGGDC